MGEIMLFATAYSGKTTAHAQRLAIDPEELRIYRLWKLGWAYDTINRREEWRKAQRLAYNTLKGELIRNRVAPLALHYKREDMIQGVSTGYSVYFHQPSSAALARRWIEDCLKYKGERHISGRANALLEERVKLALAVQEFAAFIKGVRTEDTVVEALQGIGLKPIDAKVFAELREWGVDRPGGGEVSRLADYHWDSTRGVICAHQDHIAWVRNRHRDDVQVRFVAVSRSEYRAVREQELSMLEEGLKK